MNYTARTHTRTPTYTAHSIATVLNGLDELNLFNTEETELKVLHSVVSGPTFECDAQHNVVCCRVCLRVILENVEKQI